MYALQQEQQKYEKQQDNNINHKRKETKCFTCKKYGHYSNECKYNKNNKYKRRSNSKAIQGFREGIKKFLAAQKDMCNINNTKEDNEHQDNNENKEQVEKGRDSENGEGRTDNVCHEVTTADQPDNTRNRNFDDEDTNQRVNFEKAQLGKYPTDFNKNYMRRKGRKPTF